MSDTSSKFIVVNKAGPVKWDPTIDAVVCVERQDPDGSCEVVWSETTSEPYMTPALEATYDRAHAFAERARAEWD